MGDFKSGKMTEYPENDSSQHSTPTYDDDGGKGKSDQNESYNVYMMTAQSADGSLCEKGSDTSEIHLDVTSQKKSLLKLKNSIPSKWNDTSARHVYAGFKVTRYIVENNYIFNPNLDPHIPLVSELLGGTNSEWWSIKAKLEEVLGIFDAPGIEKVANGLHNYRDFLTAKAALERASIPSEHISQKYSADATVKAAQQDVESDVYRFMGLIQMSYKKDEEEKRDNRKQRNVLKLRESTFETYLESLFRILGKFTRDREKLSLNKSDFATLQFTTSTLETLVYPEPDFFVRNPLKQVAAVVEVKPHYRQSFPLYKSHRPLAKKMKTSQATLTQDEEEDMDMEDDSSTEMISEEEVTSDKLMDDSFEHLECLKEERKDKKLDKHIRYLWLKEKKQVRCFLPQLIAELLAACNPKATRDFTSLQTLNCLQFNTTDTKRFGIGVVGIKARFVTMVIRDANGNTPAGPSDIESKSVSTNVYMTQELNLFKKSDLMMFFEILYAMGKLTFV